MNNRSDEPEAGSVASALFRPIGFLATLLVVLLVFVATVSGIFLAESLESLDMHARNIAKVSELQQDLFNSLDKRRAFRQEEIDSLQNTANALINMSDLEDPKTEILAQQAKELLSTADEMKRSDRETAVNSLFGALVAETDNAGKALQTIQAETRRWVVGLVGALFSALIVAAVLLLHMRHRLIRPLRHLAHLLDRMAAKEHVVQPLNDVAPTLLPVFASYNHLVSRLNYYETQHVKREATLAEDVRAAVTTLLQQQAALARSERLAAVGALAATLSHEIRNPLASIRAACRSLCMDVRDPDHIERLALVINEIDRITRLANRYLGMAQHKPEPQRDIDLADTIHGLVRLFSYQVDDRIRFNTDINPTGLVRLPESGFRQAVLNLLNNAQRAIGEEPGEISVSLTRDGDRITVTVSDTGPGFDPEMIEHGIRLFVTAHADGTGLGLAMVKSFVESVHGKLEIANRQPRGATVRVTVPVVNQSVIAYEQEPVNY